MPNYSGSASTLQEWKFKGTTKKFAVLAIKDEGQRAERLAELTSKVTDGLSGDALKVAMDLGEDLSKPDGLDKLVEQIESYVLAFKEDEARELFHVGSKVDGQLARQKGEPMVSYISRRNRWFDKRQHAEICLKEEKMHIWEIQSRRSHSVRSSPGAQRQVQTSNHT